MDQRERAEGVGDSEGALGGGDTRPPRLRDPRAAALQRRHRDQAPPDCGELAGADYVVFYSNRLYGTIPRLPERYPLSGEYYRLLFSGKLGYELADVQTSYASLAGVTFVDDTLSRPGIPSPGRLPSASADGLVLDMGFADESFTVYDHPMTLVFENRGRHTVEAIEQSLGRALREARACRG